MNVSYKIAAEMSSSSSEGKTSSWEQTATLLSEDYAEIVDDDADYSTPAGAQFTVTLYIDIDIDMTYICDNTVLLCIIIY